MLSTLPRRFLSLLFCSFYFIYISCFRSYIHMPNIQPNNDALVLSLKARDKFTRLEKTTKALFLGNFIKIVCAYGLAIYMILGDRINFRYSRIRKVRKSTRECFRRKNTATQSKGYNLQPPSRRDITSNDGGGLVTKPF